MKMDLDFLTVVCSLTHARQDLFLLFESRISFPNTEDRVFLNSVKTAMWTDDRGRFVEMTASDGAQPIDVSRFLEPNVITVRIPFWYCRFPGEVLRGKHPNLLVLTKGDEPGSPLIESSAILQAPTRGDYFIIDVQADCLERANEALFVVTL